MDWLSVKFNTGNTTNIDFGVLFTWHKKLENKVQIAVPYPIVKSFILCVYIGVKISTPTS